MSKGPLTYKDSGVDIAAADLFVERIGKLAASTHTPAVVAHASKYSGLISLGAAGGREPVLAATCDGVGTKLLVARDAKNYDGLGQDLVAMSVNDLMPLAARPLLFLDYVATGKLDAPAMEAVVASVARACREVGCALLGGETAEMPGLYPPGDFDLAGFAVGVVDRARLPQAEKLAAGDIVLGLPATGIHSNGFSLARTALFERGKLTIKSCPELLGGRSVADELLTPTALYVNPVLRLLEHYGFRAAAHVTGGGLLNRARRLVPAGLRIEIDPSTYEVPAVFKLIMAAGDVPISEMAATFNMGLGFLVVMDPGEARGALTSLVADGWKQVGRIVSGRSGVELGYAAA